MKSVTVTKLSWPDIQRILLRRLTNQKKLIRENEGEQQETTLYEYLLARIDVHPEKRTKTARQTGTTTPVQEEQVVSWESRK